MKEYGYRIIRRQEIGYDHVGILRYDGVVFDIVKGLGYVRETTLDVFAEGKRVFYDRKPKNALPLSDVMANVREYVANKYHVLMNNCEHFVYQCVTKIRKSPQVAIYTIGAIGLGIALLIDYFQRDND